MADSLRAAAVARVVLPDNPQRCIDADRAVGPADEADEHDEGEILCRFSAEEMEGTTGKEYRRQSVDTAVDTLGYAIIGQLFIRVGTAVSPRIFTDTVEDDNRFVHGIADDGQDSGQEGRINFQMEEGEKAQYHDQVMENGNEGGNSDFVFEPQGNIRRQGDKGDGQTHNRILRDR